MSRDASRVALLTAVVVVALVALGWAWRSGGEVPKSKGTAPVPVVSAPVTVQDIPAKLSANGQVSPVQSVEVRAQISATISAVHIREGQTVSKGDRLFSLDVRSETASLGKATAQIEKTRADLANAERNLARQKELFAQKFIAQTALDNVQNQVDSLRAQLAADRAAAESGRVALGFGEIRAPIAGRLGGVAVYPGSLVQPGGAALVSITRIDPINVSFSLPERELPALQAAFSAGIPVTARLDGGNERLAGTLSFIDNAVDGASGTIRLKASFANGDGRLWPGMFVVVDLSPRTMTGVLTVPVQAVQTGPEKKFLYIIDAEKKVSAIAVRVLLVQDGQAVIENVGDGNKKIGAGTRVVVEGAQNLRPGSTISESPA